MNVFAFEVSVKGTDWARVVNARTRGAAKADYHRDVAESWPDIPFTAIQCRKLGAPRSSEDFIRVATKRGLPAMRCGDRVRVGDATGVIVGHNSSANFDVLFDDGGRYAGQVLNVHPASVAPTGDQQEKP